MFWNGLPPHTYCTLTMKRTPHSVCSRGKAACFSLRVSSPLMTFSKNIPIQYSILSTLICSALLCKIMLIFQAAYSMPFPLRPADGRTYRALHAWPSQLTNKLSVFFPAHTCAVHSVLLFQCTELWERTDFTGMDREYSHLQDEQGRVI